MTTLKNPVTADQHNKRQQYLNSLSPQDRAETEAMLAELDNPSSWTNHHVAADNDKHSGVHPADEK